MPRSREFDHENVLNNATEAFWRHGYASTSLATLTEVTGLHKGSLYGAFQSKEDLFGLCLDRYFNDFRQCFYDGKSPPKVYLEDFFRMILDEKPVAKSKGCLVMNSCLELAHEAGKNRKKSMSLLRQVQENFRRVLSEGQKRGEFSSELPSKEGSERLLALAFSLKEMGKFRRDKAFLANVANGGLAEFGIQL